MYLVDYHMHSKYSFDGECQLKDICETAIARGLQEIAITDHADIYTEKPIEYILDCKNLYAELASIKEEYKNRLKVIIGAELGQPQVNPKESKKFLADYSLDFIIGSVHNMWNDKDVADYDFKETDYRKIYDGYVEWLLELAKNYDFDVMGHITYPSRYIYMQTGIRVDVSKYTDIYEEIFKLLISTGRGIELNMSGIARGLNETMPNLNLLKLYKSLGGEIITVGSDAHKLEHIGIVTKAGYDILKEAGFRYITTFDKREKHFMKLS